MVVEFDQILATLHTLLRAKSNESNSKVVVSVPCTPTLSAIPRLFRTIGGIGQIFEGPAKKGDASKQDGVELFENARSGVLFRRHNTAVPRTVTTMIYIGVPFHTCMLIYYSVCHIY